MSGNVQCARRPCAISFNSVWRRLCVAFALVLFCATLTRAQQSQSAVGNIEGTDVTVTASGAGASTVPQNSASAPVTNGGVVTVHSGQARLMLVSGGEIDVCGPAKFTLLQSGGAITVALDFGSVRVQLPLSTNLRIFTPTTIATPLDINGTPRDVTVGLELDDSLCVKAASGALLVENQFSGEKLVIPQSGEFFLAQGKLAPVARADSKCECVMNDARLVPSTTPSWSSIGNAPPPAHIEQPAETAVAAKPAEPSKPEETKDEDVAKPNVEFSRLAHPNEAHPLSPPPRSAPEAPPPSPESTPVYKIVMPPLTFSAASPAAPPNPTAEAVMLIRSVQVQPDWEFKGHVDAPSLDEPAKVQNATRSHGRQPRPAGEKSGFWARLKRFLSGSSS